MEVASPEHGHPTPSPDALTLLLKQKALELGFDLVGVASPDPPPHLEVYRAWSQAGRHGEMDYLSSERALRRRADPRELLPECQSILVVASNYHTPNPPQEGSRIASYALGDDYHEVLSQRLRRLVSFLESQLGGRVPHRIYTDTGPILERELAARAGLGWIGKNTCLINPRRGSYFLLAEVLLGVELVPDVPFTSDHCGSCRRCVDACPTQCILHDRTLDATRCISYLTIEHRGDIPIDLRPGIGNWLFGCDICQEVCPWNLRFAQECRDADLRPRAETQSLTSDAVLASDPLTLQGALRRSPLRRAKASGLRRNAAIVLGNQASPESLPVLTQALHNDEDPVVREHATWAIDQIVGGEAAD